MVTPLVTDLDGESVVGPLRDELNALYERAMPRRVVVNLEHVNYVSGLAIGVLVAHHLTLDRAGGALRVCQATPRVEAVLEQVRLAMIVECHADLDDAVLSHWPDLADHEGRPAV